MKNFVYFLLSCLFITSAYGQGWERFYPELVGQNIAYNLMPTSDGGAIIVPNIYSSVYSFDSHSMLRIASDGRPQGVEPQIVSSYGLNSSINNNQLLFINGHKIIAYNSDLEPIWVNNTFIDVNASALVESFYIKPTSDGYMIAYSDCTICPIVKLGKVNLLGETIWKKEYNFDSLNISTPFVGTMTTDSEDNFYLSIYQNFTHLSSVAKFSSSGDFVFNTYPQASFFESLTVVQDSFIVAVGEDDIVVINAENGNFISNIPSTGRVAATSKDNKLLIYSQENNNLVVSKLELDGTLIWKHVFNRPEPLKIGFGYSLAYLYSLPDGGVMGMGESMVDTNLTPFVFRLDSNGNTFTNRLYGNVFTDLTTNCIGDTTTANLVVVADKPGEIWYATTDSLGNYDFLLDTGTYLVHVIPPNDLWNLCQDSAVVTIMTNDTLQWNTGITTLFDCPWPVVNIDAPFLRRCFASNYSINYGNEGNAISDSAIITLTLDSFLLLQSASLPYTSVGNNIYQFSVGDLAPLQTGTFQVSVLVSCDAELGQTHCSSAEIKIANPCPTTTLETPIIKVTAACEGDSVAFKIKNVGAAPMTQEAEFVIIEDLIVMREGQFQLPAQQETIIKCPANGSTSRIYAGQAPGEPPFFATTTAIEGCNGPIQPGFWNMFPETFSREDFDQDCQPNIGAYDPNDKQAVPTGYDTEHYIARGVGLDYKIRFQNTGTDTAFTVIVRDTLSTWLDPTSVRIGAASHPYIWQLLGTGVLEFKFANILLPDSTTNLAGSQGFLSFHIDQKADVPLQTLIENSAAIFFDYNAPVITNTTFHRVGEKFISVSAWEPKQPATLVKASPNPFNSATILTLQGWSGQGKLQLQIVDLQGKTVREMVSESGSFQVNKGDLGTGIYLFSIQQNGLLVGRGKLVVQE